MLRRCSPMTSKQDLKVRIGSKQQKLWEGILEKAEAEIEQGKAESMISEIIIKLAKERIAFEKETFK